MKTEEAPVTRGHQAPSGIHTSRFPKRRVLVVDDDPAFTLLAAESLQQATFQVMVAATVKESLSAFAGFAPDLVLLDIELPDGSGFDICRAIRAAEHNSDIPVLLITGHDDTVSIEKAYEAGASDFLQKPVLWPTLPHRVDFMLRALQDRRALARSERKNRTLLEALPDASVVVDTRGYIVDHLAGSEVGDDRPLLGTRLEEAFPPEITRSAERLLAHGDSSARETQEFSIGEGSARRWLEARFRPQPDGTLLIITRDTTERHTARARIEYLAYYDSLTGLPNRQLLLLKAKQHIKQGRQRQDRTVILYVDLDRFKRINDNLGYSVGNMLLKIVGQRLKRLGGGDSPNGTESPASPSPLIVARLGGDEFVVITSGLANDREVIEMADRIRATLAEPFDCRGHRLVVTPSIGIAICPTDSDEIADLLVKSEMAMHLAKERGRNGHAFFGQSMAVRSLSRLAIESDLRRALEHGHFRICYQPKLELSAGKITGVEALLRWHHPEQGLIPPDKFIPVAEECGLIIQIGAWVLTEVCSQLKRWMSSGLAHLTAAVNVSAHQFTRRDFVDTVLASLKVAGVPADRLELEITESLLMQNLGETGATLNRLRNVGIALSIDDFGTGYSSLGYLRRLPVGALKIDRSFVKDLARQEDAAAICAAIIAMARELKLTVIAEGVENRDQLAFLQRHGCEQAQGFLIGKPMPASDLEALLRNPASLAATLAAPSLVAGTGDGAARGTSGDVAWRTA
jgi:diguanylate cyclase (GGDEF)-like protein